MSMRVEGARDEKARGAWMARDAELRGGARTRRDMEVAEREGAWVRGTRDAGRGTRDAGAGAGTTRFLTFATHYENPPHAAHRL
jgi:hypothetical protein